jgi:hypothetical protein
VRDCIIIENQRLSLDEFQAAILNVSISRSLRSLCVEVVEVHSTEFFGHILETFQVFLASMIGTKVLLAVAIVAKTSKRHRYESLQSLLPKPNPIFCQSKQKDVRGTRCVFHLVPRMLVQVQVHSDVSIHPILATREKHTTRSNVVGDNMRTSATKNGVEIGGSIGQLRKDIKVIGDPEGPKTPLTFQLCKGVFKRKISNHWRGKCDARDRIRRTMSRHRSS